jgi:hypothetical protein
MPFSYTHTKTINVILFVLHSLGKISEPSRLFLLLYLADQKHLVTYGSLITGDTYIAMKYGPTPIHALGIYQQIKEGQEQNTHKSRWTLTINTENQLVAHEQYSAMHLSESEVECLFETMHLYKNASFELLSHITSGSAWKNADTNGEIHLMDMATEAGATPEMLAYIELACKDELFHFNE